MNVITAQSIKKIHSCVLFFREVMKGQHVDPEEAVQIHLDLQAKKSVAIHWGTFALAHEVQQSDSA